MRQVITGPHQQVENQGALTLYFGDYKVTTSSGGYWFDSDDFWVESFSDAERKFRVTHVDGDKIHA